MRKRTKLQRARVLLIEDTQPADVSHSSSEPFDPVWDGALRNYARSYVRKNLWRLSRTCDEADAMQEAWIVYERCARKYSAHIDNMAWFMGLYKRSLAGRIADLATNDTRYRTVSGDVLSDVVDEDAAPFEMIGELANAGELAVHAAQAPSEVREVLALLFNAPAEIMELVAAAFKGRGQRGVLNRMLGFPEQYDALQEVRSWFDGE